MSPQRATSGFTALVALGGVLGTATRILIGQIVRDSPSFPAATLVINLTGAFALGLLVAWSRRPHRWSRHFLAVAGIGFLGSFTTFAAVAVAVTESGALAYGALSLLLGPPVAWAGLRSGGHLP